ncbi:ABC transporter ATP-binding protein [Ammoniphilus sp. YIM 78166]|uniref:ABC transporter ATP-binding protein n=1 Tax=Ammoniphilus sp. YIM 78166 TaxID=1644106 RepID=UPI001431A04E|nr:ABC transporter ATP-binding protein [Ammoniphilus sp. YIM 78166]
MHHMATQSLSIGYGNGDIVTDLTLEIPKGKITSLIGANGCGKSTILKTLARIQKPSNGMIYLDGKAISQLTTKEVAKQMAILPQSPEAPVGLTVYELVSYGRFPHQKGLGRMTPHDREMVEWALKVTGMSPYFGRYVDELSGGQRQRVWIAMALAQETDLVLLDEPTTYLDMAHQLEVLELLKKLNEEENRTIVMVLHDINQAVRFSDYICALKNGAIVHFGLAEELMTKEVLRAVYHIDATIGVDPKTNKPICITYDLFTE